MNKEEIDTILNFNEKGELNQDIYIEVGFTFDKHLIRRRLNIKELDINYEGLSKDIKYIIQQLKQKQKEILEKENGN